ncbi:zinc-dependent alcohol dehydrogenase family protein [Saccharopolyspora flava]|uniref:2-desacetyl-2-hydroxyethyl bacteriochlorophyllide A dehydrogenase n=1 Tax=Saccharopolyspora flava TaxID=95161 RepID=A0A1I6TLR7_9PSEU|nr:zinc-dependent alcohol dehydrogenase family protein [Saccharopolyspora flava]SFS90115.1 2-desacetyl-2-hydroxyethyl bacteriochlorophyllide A dehydrogenase [Saccharopolyspora flava]
MQAVVIEGPGRAVVKDVADPEPAAGQVLVRVHASGLCGTDLHLVDGVLPTDYPLTPGHEFAGEVVELGEGVSGIAVGDRVAVDPNLPCGTCRWCRAGRGNLCTVWDAIGVSKAGSAAELVAVPAGICFALPSTVSYTAGAMVEPLSCAVHGLSRLPRLPGSHYLIYGAGTMGLLMATLVRRAGAASVSTVDLNASRLDFALSYASDRATTDADALEQPDGYDVVIDATGAVPAIEDGLGRVRKGGTFLQFGVADPNARASFSPFRVYHEEIDILGSMAVHRGFQPAIELVASGTVDVESLVSATLPLADYDEAITRFRAGDGHKIHVAPAR